MRTRLQAPRKSNFDKMRALRSDPVPQGLGGAGIGFEGGIIDRAVVDAKLELAGLLLDKRIGAPAGEVDARMNPLLRLAFESTLCPLIKLRSKFRQGYDRDMIGCLVNNLRM